MSEKICGIYGLFCRPTGKWYVGQSIDIHSRWTKSYKNLKCSAQKKLYYALRKYGYDVFDKVVIESCEAVDWILDYREMYWIRHHDSAKNGYNISFGGTSGTFAGLKHSPETRARMSKMQKHRIVSDVTRLKISISMSGRKKSAEHVAAMSVSRVGRGPKKRGKKCSVKNELPNRSRTLDERQKIEKLVGVAGGHTARPKNIS